MAPAKAKVTAEASAPDDDYDDSLDGDCDLCDADPAEHGERQFRRELVEFLERRAFYHAKGEDSHPCLLVHPSF